MTWYHDNLTFRPIAESDGPIVVKWRNDSDTRQWFCSVADVTLDSHAEFCRTRPPNDLVWMVEENGKPVGMASLTLDDRNQAEYGRLLVAPDMRQGWLGVRIDEAVQFHATETLKLDRLYGEFFAANNAIRRLRRLTGWCEIGTRGHERGTLIQVQFICKRRDL